MFKELRVSSSIPESKLKRAFKGGSITLSKADLAGDDAILHLHPESYKKAMKAKKCEKGCRLAITKKEIAYPMKQFQRSGGSMYGSSIWSKIWNGIKKGFKWAKDSGVLSAAADAAVAPISVMTGQPALVGTARQGLKKLTGIGTKKTICVEQDMDWSKPSELTHAVRPPELRSEGEGLKEVFQATKRFAKKAFKHGKDSGVLTSATDYMTEQAVKKYPQLESGIRGVRKGIKARYGIGTEGAMSPTGSIGVNGKLVKGSPEAKAYMATLRARRKNSAGGSFKL